MAFRTRLLALATVLLFVSDGALSYYVANLGNYGQIYGQLGAVIVFMLWLYVTGLVVLVGLGALVLTARPTRRVGEPTAVSPATGRVAISPSHG